MIEAKNLTKRFGSLMAVDHINAQIRDGSDTGQPLRMTQYRLR